MSVAAPRRSRRTRFRRAVFGTLAAALLSACADPPPEPPRFTNLVLIVIDTLRSDHLASYGYDRTTAPFLDRLAREGIQLQGVAASSWTKPSVATLLTGLHPAASPGEHPGRSARPPSLPFLPEILQRRGFSTVGYTANWFTGPSFGFDRGFDTFIEVWPPQPLRADIYRNPASPDKPHATWATDSALELARDLQATVLPFGPLPRPPRPLHADRRLGGRARGDRRLRAACRPAPLDCERSAGSAARRPVRRRHP